MDSFQHLLKIINDLEKHGICFRLNKTSTENDRILIEAAVPGERWEIEIDDQNKVYFERFISNGAIYSEEELYCALAREEIGL